jgi:DNA-binding IclR family transcriptional regulator
VPEQQPSRTGSQTVQRALEVLDKLAEMGPMRLSEVAKTMGLNITTASRLLSELERHRYVMRESDTNRYRLGYKILQMASSVQEQMHLPDLARPVLQHLVQATGETATVNVINEDQAIIVARYECSRPLRIVAPIGTRGPLYCTAAGKVLLAFQPTEQIERILALGMPRRTGQTITTPAEMTVELEQIREQGYAVDRGEREEGLIGISGPVRDSRGRIIASCGISGSAMRMRPDIIPVLAASVSASAARLSALLGWNGLTEDGLPGRGQRRVPAITHD